MRLWSLHPKYLDQKGLIAVWREGLLAHKVLAGKTVGYRNHPQLFRFRECGKPAAAIGAYLSAVWDEAARRGYSFDRRKIPSARSFRRLPIKRGQLQFEWAHLLAKLKKRDRMRYRLLLAVKRPVAHPLFRITDGGVESWEKNKILGAVCRRGE